jgi:hypothetical protein
MDVKLEQLDSALQLVGHNVTIGQATLHQLRNAQHPCLDLCGTGVTWQGFPMHVKDRNLAAIRGNRGGVITAVKPLRMQSFVGGF